MQYGVIVPKFEWEFSEKTKDATETSPYKKVRFGIDSNYIWNQGWTASQSEEFYNALLPKLIEAGFRLDKKDDIGGVCPSIVGKTSLDKTSLYLHPTEFTGYLKEEDIEKMKTVLSEIPRTIVHDFRLAYQKEVSALTEHQYRTLLTENARNIVDWMEKAEKSGVRPYEMGNTFASNFRIKRVGDNEGFSSADTDWAFVDTLYKINQQLKEKYKEEFSLEETDLSL